MKTRNSIRLASFAAILALTLALLVFVWFRLAGGVSNREVREAVLAESASLRARLDGRCDAIDARLDRIESKIDRLGEKLDRIIEIATPRLPDGMKTAE